MAAKVGQRIYEDESPQRDAIHIAIAPVVAGEQLSPGARIGFTGDDKKTVGKVMVPIGIVDPYLQGDLYPGGVFWMFLFPGTITSLRHEWIHPAFGERGPVEESREWIETFANQDLDQTYNRLMAAAELVVLYDELTMDNSRRYKEVESVKWEIFWKHYEIVTGAQVKDHESSIFTCSC